MNAGAGAELPMQDMFAGTTRADIMGTGLDARAVERNTPHKRAQPLR